jgi:hypothetical protein
MELQENTLKIKGDVSIVLFDEQGNKKDERQVKNLVVTVGKAWIASRMLVDAGGTGGVPLMTYMAVGTASTSPAVGDTTLGTEAGRVALASASVASTAITYTASFPAGTGTGGLQEAGIFNNSSSGTMLCHTTFPIVNKAAGDTVAITWTITVS